MAASPRRNPVPSVGTRGADSRDRQDGRERRRCWSPRREPGHGGLGAASPGGAGRGGVQDQCRGGSRREVTSLGWSGVSGGGKGELEAPAGKGTGTAAGRREREWQRWMRGRDKIQSLEQRGAPRNTDPRATQTPSTADPKKCRSQTVQTPEHQRRQNTTDASVLQSPKKQTPGHHGPPDTADPQKTPPALQTRGHQSQNPTPPAPNPKALEPPKQEMTLGSPRALCPHSGGLLPPNTYRPLPQGLFHVQPHRESNDEGNCPQQEHGHCHQNQQLLGEQGQVGGGDTCPVKGDMGGPRGPEGPEVLQCPGDGAAGAESSPAHHT